MRNAILYIVIISVYSCDIFRDADDMGIYPVNYKILSLGDSYTIGQSVCDECNFPMQLKDSLQNTLRLDTLNVEIIAVTGWTTTALINSVDPVIENNSPDNIFKENDLVTLLIGVNNQYQGQSANDFRPEFIEILEKSLKLVNNRKERLFVVSIPDWGASPYGFGFDRAKVSKEINDFNSVVKEESEKRGLRYFDSTAISRRALLDRTLIASDGLHPSGKMYKLWVDKMIPIISKVNFD